MLSIGLLRHIYILILLSPYINRLLLSLNKNQIILLIFILIVVNDFFVLTGNNVATNRSGLGTLVTPYIIGSYIRRYGLIIKHKLAYFTSTLFFMYVIYIVPLLFHSNKGERIYFGLFPLIAAVLLFLIFTEIKPFSNRIINLFSTTVFASYIITENPLIRMNLWNFLKFENIKNTFVADILGAISIFILIYFIIFVIDLVRQWIFKALNINDIMHSVISKIDDLVKI